MAGSCYLGRNALGALSWYRLHFPCAQVHGILAATLFVLYPGEVVKGYDVFCKAGSASLSHRFIEIERQLSRFDSPATRSLICFSYVLPQQTGSGVYRPVVCGAVAW